MKVLRSVTFPQLVIKPEALEPLVKKMWDGTTALDLLHDPLTSFYSTGSGLMLLQTISHPAGKELFVLGLVGRDILSQGEAIMDDLRLIAKATGCRWIGGEALGTSLARAYRPLLPQVGARFLTEVD